MLPREFSLEDRVPLLSSLTARRALGPDIHDQLRDQVRVSKGRHICPSAAIVDSQSVATQQKGAIGATMLRRYTKGRKRHIVVDVLGLILAVAVTGANVQDRDDGQLVLSGLKDRFSRMERVWADGAYAGQLVEWAEKAAQFVLDIVRKPKGQIGFSVLPWR